MLDKISINLLKCLTVQYCLQPHMNNCEQQVLLILNHFLYVTSIMYVTINLDISKHVLTVPRDQDLIKLELTHHQNACMIYQLTNCSLVAQKTGLDIICPVHKFL